MANLPKRYDSAEAEKKWQEFWEENGVFEFDPESDKPIYSIDTPPPTVSGKLHIGHAFSMTQQDIMARYKRMQGHNVFQPFGTDDNGLATERLIERKKGVKAKDMPRDEFNDLVLEALDEGLRSGYVDTVKRIGLSCDWNIFYSTRDDSSREISQRMFLDLVKKDRVYRKEAPVIWCPKCETALAQVEVEDKEHRGFFNDIRFKVNGEDLIIATTRPELLPACVAVFYHPDDDRYNDLEGKEAKVPLFNFKVPIMADERVDPEKGTGIVMCCTFGDQTDMEWQKAYDLPIKKAITPDGKMTKLAGKYKGMTISDAQRQVALDLDEAGLMKGQKKIKHDVNVHERCGTKVEFLQSPQWFIRYLDLKDEFLKRGEELEWHPEHMKHRYDNWIKGLQWDWCISRQRFSGVPFPVWYEKESGEAVFADEDQLPVDPLKDTPKGYSEDEVVPEKDILDTWATSSLTPRLAAEQFKNTPAYDKLFPMSVRPQAHDIITFWLFNTVVRSHIHDNKLPWKECMISGWALDPKGKKMSKSKGNVVEPVKMIEDYSADALRFWAGGAKLGDDVPFKEKDVKTGQKTVKKLWNASKFAIMNLDGYTGEEPEEFEAVDKWVLDKFNNIVKECTERFEEYEYSKTKLEAENFFWNTFCDYYLEIVKDRIYNPDERGEKGKKSAQHTLYKVLLGTLKLFAPIMPHITEEIYHLYFKDREGVESIHLTSWPEYDEALVDEKAREAGEAAIEAIALVRKYKSDNNMSLGAELDNIIVSSPVDLSDMKEDIAGTCRAKEVVLEKADEVSITVE